MDIVNRALKAVFGGISGGLGVLIGATVAADATWADITLNTWLVAASAVIVGFGAVWFVPNTPSGHPSAPPK
jgi:uncharacterized membrane protein HdeD (DUF308 family)